MQLKRLLAPVCFILSAACGGGESSNAPSDTDSGTDAKAHAEQPSADQDDEDDASVTSVMDAALDVSSAPLQDAATETADAAKDSAADAADAVVADAGADAASPFGCSNSGNNAPGRLECTGLYASLLNKQVADGVREFRPAVTLWSNGADKARWIYLPPGTAIDATDAREWVFPVGTKFWKEFRVAGRRVETRFLQKLGAGNWLRAAYRWSDDELSAPRYDSSSTEVFTTADGSQYHIPTPVQCDDCHNGRRDFVMGFEGVLLGLDGAGGVTLEQLAKEKLLSPLPGTTHYALATGDAGTEDSAKALTWLHVNCGVPCHNTNPKSKANSFDLHLRLDPEKLAAGGAPDSTWETLASTVNIPGKSRTGSGGVRIVPHDPDASLVVQLISGSPKMPYLDTVQVNLPDPAAIAFVRGFISSMPANPADAGTDAGVSDAGRIDGGAAEAGARDASRDAADSGCSTVDSDGACL